MERLDELKYQEKNHEENTFFDGPAEFLVYSIVENLRKVKQFKEIFDESIDGYKRMDYSIRELPAIRVYNDDGLKEFESWFINGDITVDIIFPANIRRKELQRIPDTLCAAVLQRFRRQEFFNEVTEDVPGLNELGKRLRYNKALGFAWNDDIVPLTQIAVNFRIDLRQWDLYLEETYRTKDSPFKKVLGDLREIATTIKALKDDGTSDFIFSIDQK
jgi:hypothetical protein